MKILIKNGNVVTDKVQKINVLIEDGLIQALTKETPAADKIIDCAGKYVIPGIIDMHTHLREPGQEYKETLESGALSAIAGGVTTLCCMANTSPVIDNSSIAGWIRKRSDEIGLADIFPFGCVSKGMKGEELTEMGDLLAGGVCGFSDDGKPVMNSEVMRRALEYSRHFGAFISCHEEDTALFNHGSVNEGAMSTRTGLKVAPAEAESVMIARDIELARLTGGRLHICHVSSRHSVNLIRRAKETGINITAEVTPNHLSMNEDVCLGYDTNTKINPPFRAEEDRLALWQGLKDGTLDCIASDHAPHHIDDKFMEYDMAAYGVLGLQLTLPLMLKHIAAGTLTWEQFVKSACENPARVLGLQDRGRLVAGLKADIAIIDTELSYIYDESVNKSRSRNTPFWGKSLKGIVLDVIKNGKLIYGID